MSVIARVFCVMIILIGSPGREAVRADGPAQPTVALTPRATEFFEARIRPILVEKCMRCHGPSKQSSGLRLDSREAVLKGGDSGPAIVPARPEESLMIRAVAHRHGDLKMPPKGKLPDAEVDLLARWVAMGAPWPVGSNPAKLTMAAAAPTAEHWAFRALRAPSPPPVKDGSWIASPVDAFILARLEARGIAPSPPADKRTLIRRATIDLWGIPPMPEEVEAFEADASPDAYARLIDRLLASPRYGERWGRHWLDVARYADTKGYVFTQDRRYPYAFTYRDYVIDAFNSDLPYDRFIILQIAADLVQPGIREDTRPLAAMGFLTVGRRFLLDPNEIIDDRIDVVCRGLLGLTVTCARCHDHKFDPIPTEDYYSLHGVFAGSIEPDELPLIVHPGATRPAQAGDFEDRLAAARKARADYLAARRDEVRAEFAGRFSHYLEVAYQLNLNPGHPHLEESALAAKLGAQRLRGAMELWRRHLQAEAVANDPVLGPWHAFAALPPETFAAKAAGVRLALLPADPTGGAKAPAVDPLVARAVLGTDPTSMDEVVGRYVALLGRLEARWRDQSAQSPGSIATPLPGAEWESLRQGLFGPGAPLAISIDETIKLFLDQTQGGQLDERDGAIAELNATHPGAPARAMVLVDAPRPVEPQVFIRGNPARLGRAIPRRFLRALAGPSAAPFRGGSGRLGLARAIADPGNPLTARVLVNRTWHWHLGKGLVATPSDFGLRSDPPSHPELLDYLATAFLADGWSIKALHRRIMLSSTYRQASGPRLDAAGRDPENRLLWRFNPQRLDFESMRDSILMVAGTLDPALGGRPAMITEAPFSGRRTIYGFIDRQNLDGLYRTFDFATPDATSPRRFVTTVPQQALFLMNSPFLHDQARRLAALIHAEASSDPTERISRLYRRVLLRAPEPDELAMAREFIRHQSGTPTPAPAGWERAARSQADDVLSPWEQLAQVLILTSEFMFVE
jgi:hypothetical protein